MAFRLIFAAFTAALAVACWNGSPEIARGQAPVTAGQPSQKVGVPQYLILLTEKHVRKDLELTPQQCEGIDEICRRYMEGALKLYQGSLTVAQTYADSPKNLTEAMQLLNEERLTLANDADVESLGLLDVEQFRRLDQLQMRSRGWSLFLDPRIRARLKISSSQYEKLKQLFSDCATAIESHAKSARQEGANLQVTVREVNVMRRACFEKMVKSLTPMQRDHLNDMLGPEPTFHPDELQLRLSLRVTSKATGPTGLPTSNE